MALRGGVGDEAFDFLLRLISDWLDSDNMPIFSCTLVDERGGTLWALLLRNGTQ